MHPEERELRQAIAALREEAQAFIDEGKQDEAQAKIEEAQAKRKELDNVLALKDTNLPPVDDKGGKATNPEPSNYKDVFLKAIRGGKITQEDQEVIDEEIRNAMTGSEPEKGGLIIPQDISTMINEFRRQFNTLQQYVTTETVSTRSGSRVLERLSTMTPLENISDEMDPINDVDGPEFQDMEYSISDFAGILTISRTLLADTDQNLMSYIARWIGKKSGVTRNQLILNELDELDKVDLSDVDAIKDTLNVTLDPAISQTSSITTNQDGFNYLDKLKDGDGNYLLQPDPTNPTQRLLFGKPVVVISNQYFATDGSNAPFIIGDLAEAVVFFDRQTYSIDTSDTADDAFRRNQTKLRFIEREDVRLWDDEAVVYGQLNIDGNGNGGGDAAGASTASATKKK